MARGRKPASDSATKLRLDAQAPDNTTVQPPAFSGTESLSQIGLEFYATLYRSDPSRWTDADLWLLVEAAHVQQLLTENRKALVGSETTVTLSNGMLARNPLLILQSDLTRQLQTLLRDLGIRSKDGGKARGTKAPVHALPGVGGNVSSFDAWLGKQ
jgi:hypothetical protein